MDKNQVTRYSKQEMDVIKQTFKDEDVLYQIRNVFYGFPLDKEIKLSEEALKLIKKTMMPELVKDVPFGQQSDNYLNIKINEMLPEMVMLQVKGRDKANEYLHQRFSVLWGGEDKPGITLQWLKESPGLEDTERYINLCAYFWLLSYIDSMVLHLKNLANQPELTEEEQKKKAQANSTK